MKKFWMFMLAALVALVLAACGSDEVSNEAEEPVEGADTEETTGGEEESTSLTYTHDLGETTVEKNPETVVVFDMGVLDILDGFGIDVAGVPQSNVPEYLSKYSGSEYANAGSLFEPDFEEIYELDPDLIIISGRASDAYDDLAEIAPTLFMGLDTSNYYESFKGNVNIIAEIFGIEAEAEEKLAEIDADVQEVQQLASDNEAKGLIVMVNEGSMSAYGPSGRFGVLHDVFGVEPVDSGIEVSNHGQEIDFEYIESQNPEYLFVIDRGAVVTSGDASGNDLLDNAFIQNTQAYENDNIVFLNPTYWYISGGGLTSFPGMIEEVKNGLED
ncbi:iron ABC transporter substrate-binding protein [Alkalihalobacillus alcalophilus ATCC 27647 = CGMCC 1.3604]|uniref:ABC transporter n=1 Tax=Alkalihalobacillus alcalophilus ATCC 27647 = CGMCC 1.3604 TaxID=1218173 RepID=A0A094WJ15_ALKAL|nr:siderophore ABC transporter substrate-binding protein [Alkalihalobacillus alcalophilus]KGA96816.1 ABC transporter [Alkalihalobacillus alcalophilus ATCC 27647 = CGMCC 1.3604]MED1561205.1 siderophore ABC transporter substrate-binding protein [Alkalihalobacillus alcalophilus]THG88866.1 iron ABC transporter substrate-binding protein [Alkalihalobacillus alcalophilus ATCC 27647 = CGMCC 1.3604]